MALTSEEIGRQCKLIESGTDAALGAVMALDKKIANDSFVAQLSTDQRVTLCESLLVFMLSVAEKPSPAKTIAFPIAQRTMIAICNSDDFEQACVWIAPKSERARGTMQAMMDADVG
jgi:hypothetical protein